MTSREILETRVVNEKASWKKAEHIHYGASALSAAAMLASLPAALTAAATAATPAAAATVPAMLLGKSLVSHTAMHFTGLNAKAERTEYEAAVQALNNIDAHVAALSIHDELTPDQTPMENINGSISQRNV